MATIGEFFISLGFDVDDNKLKSFNDGIKEARNELAKLAAGAAVTVFAINRFVNDSVNDAIKLQKFRTETGYATEELERFFNVARSLDQTITLDDVIGAFKQLSDVVSSAQFGELPGGALFLGIPDIRNASPEEIINKVRQNRDKVLNGIAQGDVGKFRQLVEEVGLGDVFAAIMADEETYQDLFQSAVPTTLAQQEAILKLSRAYSDFNYEYNVFKREITEQLSPFIIPFLDNAIPLLKEFMQNIGAVYDALIEAFGADATEFGIIGFLVLLATKLTPISLLITTVVAGLNELGKMLRGEDNVFSRLGKFLNEVRGDIVDSDFGKKLGDFLIGEDSAVNMSMAGVQSSLANQNNRNMTVNNSPTFNVQSNQSPDELWTGLRNMNSRNYQSTIFDMGTDFEGAITSGNQ